MRSHNCGLLSESDIDSTVTLVGWSMHRRDHGGVIFIDLRDASGHVQVVIDPDTPDAFNIAEGVRNEFVLQASGKVRKRPEGTENSEIKTGQIEVLASEVVLLNTTEPMPFQMDDDQLGEVTRLTYRYLDLRRPTMQKAIRLRHQISRAMRAYLDELDFIDIETPILTRSTPEGARDYLVPSRTHPGEFFALPQSPQLFKQMLMVAGFERYYQIARCFRDEDLRADRQPEFTQLDVEMSFVEENDVMTIMEVMIRQLFKQVLDLDLPDPFPRIGYQEAMNRYGSDRPDLRIDLELTELTDLMKQVDFKVFAAPANKPNGRVAALAVPGGNQLARQQIDRYTEFVKQFGAGGLAYIKVNQVDKGRDGMQSPIIKFLPDDVLSAIIERTGAKSGDVIFFGADSAEIVNDTLGALRIRIAEDLDMIAPGWQPIWVVDFPLVEWNKEQNCWQALHHPFTAPRAADIDKLEEKPGEVLSRAYDMVLNGSEIGGGSIRIHKSELQQRILKLLGIDAEEAKNRFGFLLEALKFGAPPHGGIAFGLDRLVAMMAGCVSIRDVIAFPKTQKASCLLTEAPNQIDQIQLRELGLRQRKQQA